MGIPSPESVSTKQQRIAEMARQAPEMVFTSLSHHIDMDWLLRSLSQDPQGWGAGIDGQTAKDYAANLEGNLRSLLDRAKSGDRYKAPPVRRVYIPKGDGGTRPLGIPTFEDKVLQRAVVMVLEPIYEQDFLDCSYGFPPWTVGAPGATGGLGAVDGDGGRLGAGGGYQEVFRHPGPPSSAGDPGAQGA